MSDYEKLTQIFRELGIPFTEHRSDYIMVCLRPELDNLKAKVLGDQYNTANFEFTVDGKFVNVGLWEG